MKGDMRVPQRYHCLRKTFLTRDSTGCPSSPDLGHKRQLPSAVTPNFPRHPQAAGVSGGNSHYDLVQNWLAETDLEFVHTTDLGSPSWRQNKLLASSRCDPSKVNVFATHHEVVSRGPCNERSGTQQEPSRRRRSSSCGSFLELGISLQAKPGTDRDEETGLRRPSKSAVNQRREQPPAISSDNEGVQPVITQVNDAFEKRKRHKTREDRYEPNKRFKEIPNIVNQGRKDKRQEKSGRRRKALGKSGEDLMHAFSSRNVGQGRLTMRPVWGLGLFNNGRASSPVLRRGLPDLAFSEMNFLQQPKNQSGGGEKKSRSKTQEKGMRKSERDRNEISAYFKQTLSPVRERDVGEEDCRHMNNYVDKLGYELAQRGNSHCQPSYSFSTSLSAGANKAPLSGFSHSRGSHHGQDFETNSAKIAKASDDNTTYCTWSETINTPNPTTTAQIFCSRVTTTPESIRRSLDRTGIFEDTGIDRTQPQSYRATRGLGANSGDSDALDALDNTPLPKETREILSISRKHTPYVGDIERGDIAQCTGIENESPTDSIGILSQAQHGCKERKAVEHKGSGWQKNHYQLDSESQIRPSPNLECHSRHEYTVENSASQIPRQELAQRAYIKQVQTLESTQTVCGSRKVTEAESKAQLGSSTLQAERIEYRKDNRTLTEPVSYRLPSLPRADDSSTEIAFDNTARTPIPGRSSSLGRGDTYLSRPATLDTPIATQVTQSSGCAISQNLPARQEVSHNDHEFYRHGLPPRAEPTLLTTYGQNGPYQYGFSGLPIRGTRSNRVPDSSIASNARFNTDIRAPLYHHQLRYRNFPHSINSRTNPRIFHDISGSFSSSAMENVRDLYQKDDAAIQFSVDYGLDMMTGFDEPVAQKRGNREAEVIIPGFWRPRLQY